MRRLLAAAFVLACCTPALAASGPCMPGAAIDIPTRDGVAAVVGQVIITGYDVTQSVRLRLALEKDSLCQDSIERIQAEELERQKTEETWIFEARQHNISVAPAEVDARIAALAATSGNTVDGLKARLAQASVELAALRREIAVEIAHAKVTGRPTAFPYRIAAR